MEAKPYVVVTETLEEREDELEQQIYETEGLHTVWRMKKGDIVTDLTGTEKERVGETERGGQVGERVRLDVRDTVA